MGANFLELFSFELLLFITISWVITLLVRTAARFLQIVNMPNPLIPQHTGPIAYMGGVAIALSILICIWIFNVLITEYHLDKSLLVLPTGLIVSTILFLILGVADDVSAFTPAFKLVAQASLAYVAVLFDISATFTGYDALDRILSMLWIVTLVNAFNFIDVSDGLLNAISIVVFLCFLSLGLQNTHLYGVIIAVLLGFLCFNAPPATIFLGDAGSHLLGFIAAACTLELFQSQPLWPALPASLMFVGLPLFELVFITAVRINKGIPWWKGSPDHLALRLQAAGLTRWQTIYVACSLTSALGIAGIGLFYLRLNMQLGILTAVLGILFFFWRLLLRWDVQIDQG